MLVNTKKLMDTFAKKVIKQSIRNLEKQDKIDSGKLAKSLNYNLEVYPSGALELNFQMPDYGLYQDKGVKGSQSGRKAYKSPYKFKGKNIKQGVIESWIKRKGIQGRDKKGRFITRKSLAFVIGRSIALYGIPATRFFSKAFRQHYRRLPEQFAKVYASDVEKFIRQTTADILKK
tara:strand:+ start:5876 stop:6400 length:525 start_codon:yes stop_codon:yes gene_type:complete